MARELDACAVHVLLCARACVRGLCVFVVGGCVWAWCLSGPCARVRVWCVCVFRCVDCACVLRVCACGVCVHVCMMLGELYCVRVMRIFDVCVCGRCV